MSRSLMMLLEHNNWANDRLIAACTSVDDEILDAQPTPERWSIRTILAHVVGAQVDYLHMLTEPGKAGVMPEVPHEELQKVAAESGEALIEYVLKDAGEGTEIIELDGYRFPHWVVMVQLINHAMDHRREVALMLRDAGVTPPALDGWAFGEFVGALKSPSSDS